MKTDLSPPPASATSSSSDAPATNRPPGRPSALNARMIDALCAIIRETGVSDSGAASRMSLHPSTLSRWKQDCPDLAILLRTAREDFRAAHLQIIFEIAQAGRATSLRAATWLLERVFPQDYAPRAAERAKFQELYDAACAREAEGGEIALPHEGEPLQIVKNAAPIPSAELVLPLDEPLGGVVPGLRRPETPLQNVKNPVLAGSICPPAVATKAARCGDPRRSSRGA